MNSASHGGCLHASIGLLQTVGMKRVEGLVTNNSMVLSESLESIPGIQLVRPFDQQRVSGIVSFRHKKGNTKELFHALTKRKLSCAIRYDAVRLSPHFYQTGKPLQDILNLIEDVIL